MKKITCLLFFAVAIQRLLCIPLEELVDPSLAVVLRKSSEPLTELQFSNPSPKLIPKHAEIRNYVNENIKNLKPSFYVETLSVYKIPSSQARSGRWSETEQLRIYNQLMAISSLAGIQYYSASDKTMKTFYETSRVVDGPAGKNYLPDPRYVTIPAWNVLYARQKDLTFGENIYGFNYHTSKDSIYFKQENLTTMYISIIPAVGKNNLQTIVAIIDAEDSLLIYAAAMAKTVSLPGMGNRVSASFSNRIIAILKWFAARADTVFAK
ncbi:MAG: hypothetical protein FWH41_04250 [Treponema sp.]|nr:hypothetical protein [Treponema sp.]